MKRIAVASAMLATMSALPAFGQDDGSSASTGPDLTRPVPALGNRFYIAPMGSHTWEDKGRNTKDAYGGADGWGGALAIGKQLAPWLALELNGMYTEFSSDYPDSNHKTKMWGGGLSALIFPSQQSGLFALVGAKYAEGKDHPTTVTTTTPGFPPLIPATTTRAPGPVADYDTVLGDAGFGYLFGPISWLNQGAIRAEALYRMDFHDEEGLGDGDSKKFGDGVVNVGFLIPLGAPPQPPAVEPPPVEVVPVAEPVDSDGDGVPDDLDQCPGTPAGEPVNEVGCPLPKKPECKTPEAGQPITLEGCAAGDKIVLRGVNFEFDKSRLTSNAKTILDGVGDALTAAPSVTVEIGGHTDSKGSDQYNQKLSEKRATSVVQYLVGKGVDSGRMTSVGYGESQPVADNETDEGRELNRRVELKVTGGVAEVAPAAPAAEPAADEAAPAADVPAADAAPAESAPAP